MIIWTVGWCRHHTYCKTYGTKCCKILCEHAKLCCLGPCGSRAPRAVLFDAGQIFFFFTFEIFLGCIVIYHFMNTARRGLFIMVKQWCMAKKLPYNMNTLLVLKWCNQAYIFFIFAMIQTVDFPWFSLCQFKQHIWWNIYTEVNLVNLYSDSACEREKKEMFLYFIVIYFNFTFFTIFSINVTRVFLYLHKCLRIDNVIQILLFYWNIWDIINLFTNIPWCIIFV